MLALVLSLGMLYAVHGDPIALKPLTDSEILKIAEFRTDALAETSVVRDGSVAVVTGVGAAGKVEAQVDLRATRVLRVLVDGEERYAWPGIVVVGHRGTVKFGPENTIAGFNKAIEHGADLLEMDVRQTKDGHLVVMHDANIARTTNGRGDVALMTLEELRTFDAGIKFDAAFAGERISTLAEVLAAIKGRALPDIDFKAGDAQKLVDVVRAAGLLGQGTLYCGDWKKLREVVTIEPGFIIRPTAQKGLEGLDAVIEEFDPPLINIDWGNFSEEFVKQIHLRGKLAFVNTMGKNDNEESIERAIDAGADYVQSDELDVVMRVLRGRGLRN